MKRFYLMAVVFLMACGSAQNNPFDGNDKVDIESAKGDQGEKGEQGSSGADGTNGLPGADGKQGPPGASGQQGPQGPAGKNGEDGSDGKPGAQGPRGPQGYPGPQGPQGNDGRDGQDGKPCTVQDYGSYIRITCPGSMPVTMNKPEENLTVCVWVDPFCVQTINAKMSDINSGMYDIAHIGPCRM